MPLTSPEWKAAAEKAKKELDRVIRDTLRLKAEVEFVDKSYFDDDDRMVQ